MLTGTVLERRYRVEGLIAHGGMSTVYRGLDTRLDRPVAIKVMDQRLSGDRTFLDRLEREARSAARLHHANVVGVYDQGIDPQPDGELAFLVMELVQGGTLRDLLRTQSPLSVPLALSVLEPVLAALSAAHRSGLMHRDIKPENVLIGKGGAVKVGDFGLVRAIAGVGTTSDSMILGTVAYLSPEQVATGAADARSDVYSAGVVLYEMLTGQQPYTGDTAISVAYRHVNSDIPAPSEAKPGLPPELDELVLRATRRDPAQRPEDAEAFLTELRALRERLGIAPVPVPVPVDPVDEAVTQQMKPVLDDPDATVRAIPRPPVAGPAPIGPQGTRTMNRADLPGQPPPVPGHQPPTPPRPMPSLADARAKDRARSRRSFTIWVSVVAVLAVAVGVLGWWLGSGRWTTVPNLAGQTQESAVTAVRNADLAPKLKAEHHNDVASGTVIRTEPDKGAEVLRGSEVQVVVSRGRPVVPAIKPGAEPTEAEQLIRDAQLTPRKDPGLDGFSTEVPEGKVLKVSPEPGSPVQMGATVSYGVSKGAPPVQIPNLAGMTRDAAFAELRRVGLDPFEKGQEFSQDVEAGRVVSADPAVGQKVPKGSRVGVVISNAITVPSFLGQEVRQVRQWANENNLQLEVQHAFGGDDGARVLGQGQPPGTRVKAGSKISVTAFP